MCLQPLTTALQLGTGEGNSENVHDKNVKEEADALLVEFLTMAARIGIGTLPVSLLCGGLQTAPEIVVLGANSKSKGC